MAFSKISSSRMIIAIAVLLLGFEAPAEATVVDDYVACLIGRSAVALQHQKAKADASKAQQVAYRQCKAKGVIDENEGEGISDFVNMMVERMANEQGK